MNIKRIDLDGLTFSASPTSTYRRKDCFVEAIIPDGTDHCIRIELEKDGPTYKKILMQKELKK